MNNEIESSGHLNEIQNKISTLNANILQAQELYSNLVSNLNEWNLSNETLEKSILEAQSLNNDLAKNFDDAKNKKIQLENFNTTSSEQLDTLKMMEKKDSLLNSNLMLESNIREASDLNIILINNLNEWTAANQEVEKALIESQTLNQKLVDDLNKKQQMNLELEAKALSEGQLHDNQKDSKSLLEEIQELKKQIQETRLDRQKLLEREEILSKENAAFVIDIKSFEKKIKIYENLVKKLKVLLDRQEKEKKSFIQKQEVLLKMKDSLIEKIEIDLLKSIEKSNKKQNDWGIDDDFEDFEEKYNNSLNDLDSLNNQITQIMAENARLKMERDKTENENKTIGYNKQVSEYSQTLGNSLNELKIDNEKLEKDLLENQEVKKKLIQDLNNLKMENSQLENLVLNEQKIGKLIIFHSYKYSKMQSS